MLSSDPHEAGENHRAFWNAMKPMSIDLIEQYYDHYTPEPLFDCENREYAEWSACIMALAIRKLKSLRELFG